MKLLILFVSLILLNTPVFSKMSSEKRQELLNKLTRKVSLENLEDYKNIEKEFMSNSFKATIEYDPTKIEQIMSLYGFPESYNFLEEKNATIRVKNQQSCGCCWSHASTSALAYRYHLKGIEVNLSPQDGLSCYIRDCDKGNYLIDPQLNLIKNGTLTEECFPFNSGDGKVKDECPTSCKDGSEFKRYYAQNAYFTQDYYSKDTFYDIVPLIMYELIENGPVVSAITVYQDFVDWHKDKQKCHDGVYSYDEKSDNLGGHAVVIVGYGFMNNKFYWLIQNSWGEEVCDHGFVRVEFGQIGVESVAFSEPYSKSEGVIPIEIPVKYDSIDQQCYLKVSTTSDYNKWENTLDISFKNDEKGNNFNFQCGTNSILQEGTKINCFTEIKNYFTYKGVYKFQGGQSLGTENTFNVDKLSELSFNFYGYDMIGPLLPLGTSQIYFVSEEGSQVVFGYSSQSIDEGLPPIFANPSSKIPLSDCRKLKYNGTLVDYFLYCNIKKDEVSYFEDYATKQTDYPMIYYYLCGGRVTTNTITYQLDKTNYPIFRIKSLILPKNKNITADDNLILNVDVEGSVKNYKKQNQFIIISSLEKDNENTTYLMLCLTDIPSEAGINYNLTCFLNLEKGKTESYDNIYLLPYYIPYSTVYPYEVIIKKEIKGKDSYKPEPDPEPKPDPDPEPEPDPKSSSSFYKISFGFMLLLLLL
jgi:C1A family cysteine protease